MGKLFTRLLSMLFVFCLFSISIIVSAQQSQKTVQLYAENVSSSYNVSNEYQVKISVRDFIQLVQFNLALHYETSVFIYKGFTLPSSLSGVNVSQTLGNVNLTWDNGTNPVTIGDGVVADLVTLKFSIKNYPYNTVNSYLSDLTWTKNDFFYYNSTTGKISNQSFPVNGKLNVTVAVTDIKVSMTHVDCPDADADIEITSPVGTGYTYSFNEDPNPANWTWSADSHSSAPTGSANSIRVKDANGNISLVKRFNVGTVIPVTYTAIVQGALCKGGNGEIQITAAGGTGPYTYWVVPKADFAKVQTSLASTDGKSAITLAKYKKTNFQILRPVGEYYVAVDDANLCRDLTDATYWTLSKITEPAQSLSISTANVKGVNCSDSNDGSFDVTVAGGALPEYQVSITGQSATTVGGSYSFTGVAPGDYVVTAMDVNGCTVSKSVTIAPKAPITFAFSVENTTCGGLTDGTIDVNNIAGGTGPYTLTIATGGTSTVEANVAGSHKFINLSPNYYSLTITDANNCTVINNQIAVQSPTDIKFNLTIKNTLCFVGDASVQATGVTGGAGVGYVYSMDGATWQSSDMFIINQPFAPSYTVYVKNANGFTCTVTKTFTIVAPTKLVASLRPETAPSCAEGANGKIEADISGGTPPYSYSVNGGSWIGISDALATINGLPVGNYSVNIKDANGCLIADPLNGVIAQDKNIIVASATKIGCFDDKAPIIASWTSWADKGVSRLIQYKYALTEAALLTSGIGFNPGVTPFAAGTYYVGAIDQFDCMSNVVQVVIDQNPELIISSVVANAATCYGTATGTITIQAIGGTVSPYLQYALLTDNDYSNINESKWVDFTTYDAATQLSTVSLVVAKGVYFIAVRDNHCTTSQKNYGPVTITSYEKLLVDELLISKVDVMCNNNPSGSINLPMGAVSGGAGAYLFTLLDGSGTEIAGRVGQATGMFANLKAGTYSILVNDVNNCTPYHTALITITEPAEIIFTPSSQNTTGFGIEDGKINFTAVSGGNGTYTAVITGKAVDGTSKSYTQAISDAGGWTVSNVAASEAAGYDVKVMDGNNCESIVKKVVVLQPDKLVVTLTKGANEFTCPGVMDGLIVATTTGGVGAYSYTLYQDDISVSADVATSSFSVQTGHTFKVVVKDANGITANASLAVIPVVPIAVTIADITCFGETNPIAKIAITGEPGRTFHLQYAPVIDGTEGSKSAVIPVTDFYSFTADLPYGSDGTLSYNFYVDDILCAGKVVSQTFVKVANTIDVSVVQLVNEVNATLTVTGGVGPYNYTFGASHGVANSGEAFVVTGIKTVSADVTIADAHGCTVVKPLIATPISVTANPASGDNQTSKFDVVLTFNRSVTVAAGDITGGTFIPGTGTSFTVSMTGVEFADLTLALGTGIVDDAGNTFEGKSFMYKVGDFTSPTLVVTPRSSTVSKTFTVRVKFSEPVTGVSLNSPSIIVTGGTLLSVVGSSDVYILTFAAKEQADVTIVLNDGITDKSVNANKFAGITLKYTVGDFTKPTLVVTPPATPVTKTFTVGLKFSEPVIGVLFNSPNVKVTGATLLSVDGSGADYTLTISGNELANVNIVLSNAIKDKSQFANRFAGVTLNYTIGDFTAPQLVTMTPNVNTVLIDNHPTFIMTFSKNVMLGAGGNLVVYKLNSITPALTIPITASMIVGKDVTVSYTTTQALDLSTRYYVLVDGSALVDNAGNKFAGVKNVIDWTFKTGAKWPMGIDTNPTVSEFNVYPNPFYNVINLVASSKLSKVVVTNVAGQVVKEVVNPANSIPLSELRSGIYFISLYDMDDVIAKTIKIVKR